MGQYSRQKGPVKQKQTEIQKMTGFNSGAFLPKFPKQTTWSQYFSRPPENSHASLKTIKSYQHVSLHKIPIWGWANLLSPVVYTRDSI